MNIEFATCDRKRALGFIRKVYPSSTIEDSIEGAGLLLDLVEADVVRVQDPMMYGSRISIVPSKNFDEAMRAEVIIACERLAHHAIQSEKEL